jgi:hypothetical protein
VLSNLLDAVGRDHAAFVQDSLSKYRGTQRIQAWSDTPVATTLMHRLLNKLWYHELLEHLEQIAEAFTRTFEWIFGDPEIKSKEDKQWSSFQHWLCGKSEIY